MGPMARTVEDVAILFDVLADPSALARLGSTSEGLSDLPGGIRMGIHADYFGQNLDPEVRACVDSAVSDLEKLGLERQDVSIPEVRYQGMCRDVVLYVEAASCYEASIRERPEDFGEDTRELLRLGLLIRATEYLTAQRARRRVLQAFRAAFHEFDVLVTPTVPVPAPRVGEETLSNGEELRSGLLRLVTPFNTVGFPALSLPCGFTKAGLPVGLQLAARPFHEKQLLPSGSRLRAVAPVVGSKAIACLVRCLDASGRIETHGRDRPALGKVPRGDRDSSSVGRDGLDGPRQQHCLLPVLRNCPHELSGAYRFPRGDEPYGDRSDTCFHTV